MISNFGTKPETKGKGVMYQADFSPWLLFIHLTPRGGKVNYIFYIQLVIAFTSNKLIIIDDFFDALIVLRNEIFPL